MSPRDRRARSGNPAVAAQAGRRPTPRTPSGPSRPGFRGPFAPLLDAFATERIPSGVDYPHALRTTTANPFTSMVGVTLGLLSFMVITPLLMRGLGGLYWLAIGSPGDFDATFRALTSYELPFGLVVGHLGLATLIPLSMALVLFIHRVRPGILGSVLVGLRWGWLGACLLVAFASLWLVLVVQNLTQPGGPSFALNPQPGAVWFIVIMLLTTPLQAAAEEYFFRGYLMQSLGSMVASPWFGILTSAAVFTAFHGSLDPALVLDRFAFGVLAGWLVVRTGGLEAGIAAHVANNVTSFGLAALTASVAQVKAISEVTWIVAAWDVGRFALFTVLIVLLARRWKPATETA
ncbi:CPBP family intramembrane metalloprotease [Propioniciclava coleopterorum]|uniref:CPBP family intramembrane metalloprotease n=1 Tax=Propioniciclava coleopterorum TaxID=2714937 RepID=A0A6G7Y992_9ACTN|nr:type II CAAX endopeptidase family protein [Propioniciclava coleopterorum]QIK73363.1 CPBP family intramembrane metalloprotease [Propioniciclava coleopterorum]